MADDERYGSGRERRRAAEHLPRAADPRPRAGERRRRTSAGAALVAMLLGFFAAGLLDAGALEERARGRPLGAQRTVVLGLLRPVTALSGALRLDRPAAALNEALGRGEPHHTLAEVPDEQSLWPREVTGEQPLRVYVAGDSMAQVFGSSLVNLAEGTGLMEATLDYHVSTGLSRPDFYDWPQRLIDQLVNLEPDAVVILFGANDGQDVMYQGKVLKVGSRAWQDVYATRVERAMRILSRGGRRVYWVGNPIMRDKGYRERIAMMNRIYAEQAEEFPGVVFVSTWKTMADEQGSYAESLRDAEGRPKLVRHSDGIHLTRVGGDRMAGAVLDVIKEDWGIAE
jgi:hypothetical protein